MPGVCLLRSQPVTRPALQISGSLQNSACNPHTRFCHPVSLRRENRRLSCSLPFGRSSRTFLRPGAGRSVGSTRLQGLLVQKLGHEALSSSDSDHSLAALLQQHSSLPESQLAELEPGLDKLLQLFSAREAVRLLQHEPLLLSAPLASWLDFLQVYGFSGPQVKNLVATCPGLMARGDPATAGAAILHLQQLGFDNVQVRERVVAFCPQVLMMAPPDIDTLVRLWDKFNCGLDEQQG